MGFSRQEHWNGLPCPPSGDLPNPGIEPASHVSPELAGVFLTASTTWEILNIFLKKLCPTLCDPMNCSPPGSSVLEISQARTLGWVAIPFCKGSSWPRDRTHISCIGRWILYCWACGAVPEGTGFVLFLQGGERFALILPESTTPESQLSSHNPHLIQSCLVPTL